MEKHISNFFIKYTHSFFIFFFYDEFCQNVMIFVMMKDTFPFSKNVFGMYLYKILRYFYILVITKMTLLKN